MTQDTKVDGGTSAAAEQPKAKEGGGEIVQTLAAIVAAALVGIGGSFLWRWHQASARPARTPAAVAATGPYVVIDSDAIGAKALQLVQQAFQRNPALLPHIGEVGKIVGGDVNALAQQYAAQGDVVYMASAFLAYPPAADRTDAVEQRVLADVQQHIARWSQEKAAPAQNPLPAGGGTLAPSAGGGQTGFEP